MPDQATAGVTESFSIEQWYHWNGGGRFQIIFSFGDDTSNYLLAHPSGNGGHTVEYRGPDAFLLAPQPPLGARIHLVTTCDHPARRHSMYVNGTLVSSVVQSQRLPFNFETTAAGRTDIGGRGARNSPSLNGVTEEFRIWGHALTHAEVAQHFERGPEVCPPPIVDVPAAVTACPTGPAAITASAVGGRTLRYSRQIEDETSPNGWRDLTDGPIRIGGVTTCASMRGSRAPTAVIGMACTSGEDSINERRFRCIVSNSCGSVASDPVTLNVCRADFNGDGFIDFFDLDDDVAAFEAGC